MNCDAQNNSRKRRYHFRDRTAAKKRKIQCLQCNQIFQSKHGLDVHVGMMHKKEESNNCRICERQFRHPNELENHLNQRHADASHESVDCNFCSQTFKNELALSQHIGKIHPHPTSKNCGFCTAKCRHPNELLKHLIEVHNSDPEVLTTTTELRFYPVDQDESQESQTSMKQDPIVQSEDEDIDLKHVNH